MIELHGICLVVYVGINGSEKAVYLVSLSSGRIRPRFISWNGLGLERSVCRLVHQGDLTQIRWLATLSENSPIFCWRDSGGFSNRNVLEFSGCGF